MHLISAPKSSGGFTRQQNFRDRDRDREGGGGPFRESRGGGFTDFEKPSSFSRAFRDRDRDERPSDRSSSRPFTKRFGDRDRDRDDRGGSRSSVFGKKFDREDRDREFKREPVPERGKLQSK